MGGNVKNEVSGETNKVFGQMQIKANSHDESVTLRRTCPTREPLNSIGIVLKSCSGM